jgi:Raf kinase inhibitor-like YbhB/YbcL family protein
MRSIRAWQAGLALALSYCALTASAAGSFQLDSPTLAAGATLGLTEVYDRLGCNGRNISPALRWSGAPAGTRSFAITLFDPDAPGSGWWHWLVFDIPASVTTLAAGVGNPGGHLPPGSIQGRNDFGALGYGGPCPPRGDKPHRYVFTIYALKTDSIEAPPSSAPARIEPVLNANALAKASFTAFYGR